MKNNVIQVRVNDCVKFCITKRAEELGMSVSEFLVGRALASINLDDYEELWLQSIESNADKYYESLRR